MTYLQFLFVFLILPSVLLALSLRRSAARRQLLLPALFALLAVIYTTPWDNYLVATGVWWYDPALVTGITLGWVPLEEYVFFVLQPLLTGLWLIRIRGRLAATQDERTNRPSLRRRALLAGAIVWLVAAGTLLAGWDPGTYLALELAWALPPLMLQLAFGADILWRQRRLVAWSVLPATVALSAADALAIRGGTWTINPALSLQILVGGVLPLEELIFFLLTNSLIAFGLVLLLAPESQLRLQRLGIGRGFAQLIARVHSE